MFFNIERRSGFHHVAQCQLRLTDCDAFERGVMYSYITYSVWQMCTIHTSANESHEEEPTTKTSVEMIRSTENPNMSRIAKVTGATRMNVYQLAYDIRNGDDAILNSILSPSDNRHGVNTVLSAEEELILGERMNYAAL